MASRLFPVLAGAAAGILSGFGVGGGTLLLIFLTAFAGMDQHSAQGINLLYFLPAAATALPSHIKNGYIQKSAAVPAIAAGLAGTCIGSLCASALEDHILRRVFGVYLLYIGVREFRKKEG